MAAAVSLPSVYPVLPVLFKGMELNLTVNGEKSYSRFPINESIVDEFVEVKSISVLQMSVVHKNLLFRHFLSFNLPQKRELS